MNPASRTLGLTLVAAFGLTSALCALPAAETAQPPPAPGPSPPIAGDPFRIFSATDLSGKQVDLAALLKGKAGLVAFWASWCQPCIDEVPRLKKIADKYGDRGLVMVGIGIQEGGETIAKQRHMAARQIITYLLLFDQDRLYQTAYALRSLPLTMLVGRDGKIRWRDSVLPDDMDARIESVLQETQTGEAGKP